MDRAKCRSCAADIVWIRTEAGNLMPLDAEPCGDGNVVVLDGVAKTVTPDDLFEPQYPESPRYKAHFATCAYAASWRKKGKKS